MAHALTLFPFFPYYPVRPGLLLSRRDHPRIACVLLALQELKDIEDSEWLLTAGSFKTTFKLIMTVSHPRQTASRQ